MLVMSGVAFALVVRSDGTVDQKYVVWSDDQGKICDCFLAEKQENWLRLKDKNKIKKKEKNVWTALSEFGTYRLCEQRRFRRACASAQSRQNFRCSLIEAVRQEEPSDRKPDPWPLWMAGHAQLKFVMTECSKTQIRLTRLICKILKLDLCNN